MWVIARLSDINVSHAAAFAIILDGFVFVGRLGELGDDVPCVQKARDESQNAEENVNERIGATNATLYPNWQRREDDGEHAKKNVCGTHGE